MNLHRTILTVFLSVFFLAIQAQNQSTTIKITDINGVTTVVKNATSSSSTSCNSPDFPALKGGSRRDINFNELKFITVVHDRIAGENDIYIGVELEYRNGSTEPVEMIRNIRFSGKSDAGDFSIAVKEISLVEVLH
ncbi:MAG: hypothetical protein V2B15_11110 [Bacteroidota bacterium]